MSIFGERKKDGGFMDQIRCDEQDYLIWKWRPEGSEQGAGRRENSIRWGSSLRVREGSVAVFVYKKEDGAIQDYIEGPCDEILKTSNLPVIASIIGTAYEGGTPFQAEVYFINLAEIIQIKFAVPFFDVYDPRFLDFGVPTAVRGTLTYKIDDYRGFIKLHRLDSFSMEDFQKQIRDAVARYVKSIVANAPADNGIPVVQLERKIAEINDAVAPSVKQRLLDDFGVAVSGVDIAVIEIDKSSEGFKSLKSVTQDIAMKTTQAQAAVNIKNLEDQQRINAENLEATLKAQREEAQYAQRKETESKNFAAYQLEQQAAVGIAGAEALGQMGSNGATSMSTGSGGGGGMDPAAMMAGMAMGGAIGQNMAGMMNGMMGGVSQQGGGNTPPPVPVGGYNVVIDGKAAGPFDMNVLSQMAISGQITQESLVWKAGMSDWVKAGSVDELKPCFGSMPPIPADM